MRKESISSHIDALFDKFTVLDDGSILGEAVVGPYTMQAYFKCVCVEDYSFDH